MIKIRNIILIILMLLINNKMFSQTIRSESIIAMQKEGFEIVIEHENNIEFKKDIIHMLLVYNNDNICKIRAIYIKGVDLKFWEDFLKESNFIKDGDLYYYDGLQLIAVIKKTDEYVLWILSTTVGGRLNDLNNKDLQFFYN